jgi:glycosyltransferase involved in cell wall biosynthesis
MAALEVPPDVWWEILVIDNGSDDATGEVIASYAGRVPLRSVRETAPGLSNARNRAVAEAGGAYIIWTDDDVLVDEGWLAAYCRAFRRWPDADIFGGPIEPLFEGTPPAWIARVLEQIGPVYGRQTLGEEPVRLQPDKVGAGPYGGNMALTRTALLGFPFDPQLGVQRGEYGIGEETEVIKRMLLAGLDGWWTPEPKVRHVIPRASQNVSYVRRWMVGSGRYIAAVLERDCRGWRNHPVRLCVRIIRHELLLLLRRPLSSPEVWIRHVIQAGRDRGRLHGHLRMRRGGSA